MEPESTPVVEGRFDALPSVPLSVVRARAPAEGRRAPEAEKIVLNDPSLAAVVLRLANSPVYGRAGTVASIDAAVRLLGPAVVRKIAAGLAGLEAPGSPLDRHRFLEHSVASAAASRALAKRLGSVPPEEAHAAGLLHSLGQMVFALGSGKRYAEVQRRCADEKRPLVEVEKEVFGLDHGRAGALLAERWNLPPAIRDAIAHHHRPDEAGVDMPPAHRMLVEIVAAADAILSGNGLATCCRNGRDPQPVGGKAIGAEDAAAALEAAREGLRETLAVLGVAEGGKPFAETLGDIVASGPPAPSGIALPGETRGGLDAVSTSMADALRAMRTAASAEEAWEIGLRGIRASLGVDRVLFYAYDAERARLDLRHGLDDTGTIRAGEKAVADFPLAAGGGLSHSIRDGRACVVDDLGADGEFLRGIGVSRVAAAPVDILEKTHGVLTADNPFAGRPVDTHDASMLGIVANLVGLSIENLLLQKQAVKLRSLAERDELTGVNNRRNLMTLFQRELDRSRRYGSALSVAMVDIDFFKSFNDTYGHQAGDEVLRTIAQVLVAASREIDIIGRYGGEEFVALLPETTLDQALVYSERLRARVEMRGADLRNRFPKTRPLTISVGVSQAVPQAGDDVERIIARVDEGLYEAKEAGRNKVIVKQPPAAQ